MAQDLLHQQWGDGKNLSYPHRVPSGSNHGASCDAVVRGGHRLPCRDGSIVIMGFPSAPTAPQLAPSTSYVMCAIEVSEETAFACFKMELLTGNSSFLSPK